MKQAITQSHTLTQQNISVFRHDLRNRLSALNLELYLLERKVSPELRSDVALMKDEIGEINHLIDDLNSLG